MFVISVIKEIQISNNRNDIKRDQEKWSENIKNK